MSLIEKQKDIKSNRVLMDFLLFCKSEWLHPKVICMLSAYELDVDEKGETLTFQASSCSLLPLPATFNHFFLDLVFVRAGGPFVWPCVSRQLPDCANLFGQDLSGSSSMSNPVSRASAGAHTVTKPLDIRSQRIVSRSAFSVPIAAFGSRGRALSVLTFPTSCSKATITVRFL